MSVVSVGNLYAASDLVAQIRIVNGGKKLERQIREVVLLKEGQPYSEEDLQETMQLIQQWGRFERTQVFKEHREDGWYITFDLLPGLIISQINVRGQFPYLTSRISRNVGLRVGEVYQRESIIDEVKKVRRFFEREGYFATTVKVKEDINDSAGVVALTFNIKKGPRLRWREIHVEGNSVFPYGYFVTKINPWFPYKPSRLRDSVEKIRDAYVAKGYPRARVRVKEIRRDFENRKVDLWLTVNEQSHLTLDFVGNSRISNRTLRKTVTFFKERSYDYYEIKQSEAALQELYYSRGFWEATVKSERTIVNPHEIRVTFNIQEGPQTLVKKIHFKGDEDVNVGKIRSKLSLKEAGLFSSGYLSKPALQSDRQRIPRLLELEGYPDGQLVETTVLMTPLHDRANIIFSLDAGIRDVVSTVEFVGADKQQSKDLRKRVTLKPGIPYSDIAAQNNVGIVKNYLADNGYPYAEVKSEAQVNPATGEVALRFLIDKGALVKVGEILIIGINHARPSTIRSALGIKRGDPYSRARILKGESVMRRLGAFKSVDVKALGLDDKLESVPLMVQVEEQEQYTFDIKASYSTDNKLSGQFIVTNYDVFGYGKRMNLKLDLGFDLRRAESNYFDPHFFGSDYEMVVTGFIEDEDRPSFQVTQFGGALSFLREIGRTMSALAKFQISRQLFRGGTPDPSTNTEDTTLPQGILSFNYDTRDYFADPRKGMFALVSYSQFFRVVNLGANFTKLQGQYIYYWSPMKRVTLVNSLRMGGIIPIDNAVVPRDELFFIGGDYSIRGFEQDKAGPLDATGVPIGQQVRMILNSELQFRVIANFKIAAFADQASASDKFELTAASMRHSAGVGLRYITPVGPIRLDYGFILDRRPGEGVGRLHFTFGYAF